MDYPTAYRAASKGFSTPWAGFQTPRSMGGSGMPAYGGNYYNSLPKQAGFRGMSSDARYHPSRYWWPQVQRFPKTSGKLPGGLPPIPQFTLKIAFKMARRAGYWAIADAGLDLAIALWEKEQAAQPQQVVLSPPGSYTLVCDLGTNGTELSGLYAGNVCNTGQYITGGFPPTLTHPYVSEITPSTGFPDGVCHRVWQRTGTATADPALQPATPYVPPVYLPWPDPQTVPGFMPLLDPATMPIGKPAPHPQPLPYKVLPLRKLSPFRDPVEQTQRGPAPSGTPGAHAPPHLPIIPPSATGQFPGGVVIVRPPNFIPPNQPPRPREKEKKMQIAPPASAPVMRVVGGVTEAMDLINALYWAIPESRRPKGFTNPAQKAAAIYKNLDHIDWEKALQNVVANEVQDQAIGRSSKAQNKAQRDAGWNGRPVGAGSGTGGASGIAF